MFFFIVFIRGIMVRRKLDLTRAAVDMFEWILQRELINKLFV